MRIAGRDEELRRLRAKLKRLTEERNFCSAERYKTSPPSHTIDSLTQASLQFAT